MTQELFYTSAPQGLRPGSRGFCTVMSTSGMAKNLADRLEALSGYRHVFAANDPNAKLNPIVHSHLRVTVGGKPFHILSRISAAGLDYTQRSNKFAHHVVLEQKELVPAGPAALLAAPGFMESSWDGEPRVIGAGRRPPAVEAKPAPCRYWQRVAGDAGWAGVLAETATAGSSRIAAVIYKPGTDTLRLVCEAMSLLPPALRWQVTFSTYYTKLPPEIECQWRFVLAGSPEAKAIERSPQILIVDTSAQSQAPQNVASRLAIAGELIVPAATHTARILSASQAVAVPEINSSDGSSQQIDDAMLSLPPALDRRGVSSAATGFPPLFSNARPNNLFGWKVAAIVAAAFLVVSGVCFLTFSRSSIRPKVIAVAPPQKKSGEGPQPSSGTETQVSDSTSIERATKDESDKPDPGPDATKEPKTESELLSKRPAPTSPAPPDTESAASAPLPTEHLKACNLPPVPQTSIGTTPKQGDNSFPLSQAVALPDLNSASVRLLGARSAHKQWVFEVSRIAESGSGDQRKDFKVMMNASGSNVTKSQIGTLSVGADSVAFQWSRVVGNKASAALLGNCLLEITSASKRYVLPLREPTTSSPIQVKLDQIGNHVDLNTSLPWPTTATFLHCVGTLALPGYAQRPASDGTTIQLKHSNPRMPQFTLKLNTRLSRVELAYDWELEPGTSLQPGNVRKKRSSLGKELAKLQQEKDGITQQLEEVLGNRLDQAAFERRKIAKKEEIENLNRQLTNTSDEIKRVEKAINILDQVLHQGVEATPIHFSIDTRVDGEHLTLVTSGQDAR